MALLILDNNKLELTVQIGVLEIYKPDKEVKSLHEDVEILKKKLERNAKRIIGKQDNMDGYNKVLEKNKETKEKWMKYVNKTYLPELKVIVERLVKKNKKICPNYEEVFSA